MKITQMGKDYVVINEDNLESQEFLSIPRIHIIKLHFSNPTKEKIERVIYLYPKTNRFVIEDNIRFYNDQLKYRMKKFYVENPRDAHLISFFRKNNKILVNFNNLNPYEKEFLLSYDILQDLLKNVEVIQLYKEDYNKINNLLKDWDGNVIISE